MKLAREIEALLLYRERFMNIYSGFCDLRLETFYLETPGKQLHLQCQVKSFPTLLIAPYALQSKKIITPQPQVQLTCKPNILSDNRLQQLLLPLCAAYYLLNLGNTPDPALSIH